MLKNANKNKISEQKVKHQVYVKRSTKPEDGGGKKIPHVYKQSTSSKPQKKNRKINMARGFRIFNEIIGNIQTDRHFAVTLLLNGPFYCEIKKSRQTLSGAVI